MAPGDNAQYEYITDRVKVSSTTNDINDENYFEDYYEEKKIKVKIKQTER